MSKTTSYEDKEYWISRFENEESFEWLLDYHSLEPIFNLYLRKGHKILNIGNGNSKIPFGWYKNGYGPSVNIDFCENVTEKMKTLTLQYCIDQDMERVGVVEKADNASGLDGYHCNSAEKEKVPGSGAKERGDMYKNITPQWKAVNALDMACFDEECFDFVFEKSTSDAIACGDCDGSLLKKLENEIYRVTKPGSKWLSVSYSSSRWDGIIETSRWDANVIKIKIDTDITDGEKTTSHTVMRPEVYQNCYVFTKKIPKC